MKHANAEERSDGAMVVAEKGSPLPAFTGAEMGAALVAYRDLQAQLDRAMPDQIMAISGKAFRKKGYWRAIATAFNLQVTCTSERREVAGEDWGWLVTYRATASSGRSADGDGACFASEKSRGRMAATEHNFRSHAHTRGFNRAVSNLVAFGEVSAEEITEEDRHQAPAPDRKPAPRAAASSGSTISEAQRKRLWAVTCDAVGREDAEGVLREVLRDFGFEHSSEITRDAYDDICKAIADRADQPQSTGVPE